MKLRGILYPLVFLISANLSAQESNMRLFRYFELFGGVGTSHYFGEIGGKSTRWPGFLDKIDNIRDFDPLESRISMSFGSRYLLNRTFAVSGQVSPVWLSGNDRGSIYESRGWHFNTYMIEFSGQMEYYFLRPYTGFNPYMFAGFGGTYRYTTAFYPTRSDYVSSGNVAMVGIGYRQSNNKVWTHGAEVGFRYALSDFMEMLHGSTKNNDCYYLVQYRISYHLTRGSIYTRDGMLRKSLPQRINNWYVQQQRKKIMETPFQLKPGLSLFDNMRIRRHLKKVQSSDKKYER